MRSSTSCAAWGTTSGKTWSCSSRRRRAARRRGRRARAAPAAEPGRQSRRRAARPSRSAARWPTFASRARCGAGGQRGQAAAALTRARATGQRSGHAPRPHAEHAGQGWVAVRARARRAGVASRGPGAVLAGSKYGVRQTRGKFGLGSKMVGAARLPRRGGCALSALTGGGDGVAPGADLEQEEHGVADGGGVRAQPVGQGRGHRVAADAGH